MRILITAGGTREYIDPVRFITNSSSGRMGYELARAAIKAGHKVTLITTVDRKVPLINQANIVKVENAAEMFVSVKQHFDKCDCLIMSAAVADYTPIIKSKTKIKKNNSELTIKLKPTADILKWAGKHKKINKHGKVRNKIVVGFALEDKNLLQNAEKKLKEKNLDMIIANDISSIGNEKTSVYIKSSNTSWQIIADKSKSLIARKIMSLLECHRNKQ
jgi:phosphopantothenoylcysteine decarboxylase / phosphopantothenate---cysteine ligase